MEAGVRAISMTSASKTFNLAGLQQATAFCRDRALLDRLEKTLRDAGVVSGNIFGMTATEAAFAHGDAWLDAMLDYVAEGYAIFREETGPGCPVRSLPRWRLPIWAGWTCAPGALPPRS